MIGDLSTWLYLECAGLKIHERCRSIVSTLVVVFDIVEDQLDLKAYGRVNIYHLYRQAHKMLSSEIEDPLPGTQGPLIIDLQKFDKFVHENIVQHVQNDKGRLSQLGCQVACCSCLP